MICDSQKLITERPRDTSELAGVRRATEAFGEM